MPEFRQDRIKFYWNLALPWMFGDPAEIRHDFLAQTSEAGQFAYDRGYRDIQHIYCFPEQSRLPKSLFSHLLQVTVLTDRFQELSPDLDVDACILSAVFGGKPVGFLPFDPPDASFLSTQVVTTQPVHSQDPPSTAVRTLNNELVEGVHEGVLNGSYITPLVGFDGRTDLPSFVRLCFEPTVSCHDMVWGVKYAFDEGVTRAKSIFMATAELLIEGEPTMVPVLNGEHVDAVVDRIGVLRGNIRLLTGGLANRMGRDKPSDCVLH